MMFLVIKFPHLNNTSLVSESSSFLPILNISKDFDDNNNNISICNNICTINTIIMFVIINKLFLLLLLLLLHDYIYCFPLMQSNNIHLTVS